MKEEREGGREDRREARKTRDGRGNKNETLMNGRKEREIYKGGGGKRGRERREGEEEGRKEGKRRER